MSGPTSCVTFASWPEMWGVAASNRPGADSRDEPGHDGAGRFPWHLSQILNFGVLFPNFGISLDGRAKSAVERFGPVPLRGAARDRHETRGGMRWTRAALETTALCSRTAKACGPDPATLGSSLR